MNIELRVQSILAEAEKHDDWSRAAAARGELALTLARTLDEGAGMSTAAVSRELRATIDELAQFVPGAESVVDALVAARRARRSGRPAQPLPASLAAKRGRAGR